MRRAGGIVAALLAVAEVAAAQDAAAPAPVEAPAPAPVEAPAPAQPAARGAITGTVVDADTGTPLPGARIEVVAGGEGEALSDADGQFRLPLPPGRYELRVYFPIYEIRRIRRLELDAGGEVRLALRLRPAADAVEEVAVEAEPERKSEAGLLLARRRSSAMTDGVSAQEMSRGGDSAASDAVRRVVSATIEDGRYVLIRGLGDRYVTALINGAPLPSPEPDRQAIPLDLFPTSLLASLTIDKSYAPWNPGAFGGGTVQLETTSYPRALTATVKAGLGVDSGATGQGRLTYDGGGLDALGFDDGARALPGEVPLDRPARIGDGLDRDAMEDIGEAFPNVWSVDDATSWPSTSLGLSLGDTVRPAGKELGYVGALSFGRSLDTRSATITRLRRAGGELEPRETMTAETGTESAGLGGLLAAGFRPHPRHDLDAVFLYAHAGEVSAQQVTGLSESDNQPIEATRLGFVERSLAFLQLTSRHRLPAGVALRLQGNLGQTGRDEPDARDVVYLMTEDGRARFKNEAGSGQRFFGALDELTTGASADLTASLGPLTLRTGATAQRWSRSFSARRFRYAFVGSDPATLFLPAEEIFGADTIGPDFRLEERTLQPDAYDADLTVLAGYGAVELERGPLRVMAGARYERSHQALTTGSPYALGEPDPDDRVDRTDGRVLPAIAATLALTDAMSLRAAASYTLARPMFRELAPFLYFDYARRQSVSGNPMLVDTRITNADVRWEWFHGDADLLAAGAFYKRFDDPIEEVVVSAAGGDTSFANAPRATSLGVELEGRMSLGRLTPALEPLRAFGNLTLLRSEVELADDQIGAQTSPTRALQGQAPYVVNLGLSWTRGAFEASALYNVVGPRITEVGFETLPDTIEQPHHRVDLGVAHTVAPGTRLKLGVKNVLAQPVRHTQGGLEVFGYDPGVTASASVEWTPL